MKEILTMEYVFLCPSGWKLHETLHRRGAERHSNHYIVQGHRKVHVVRIYLNACEYTPYITKLQTSFCTFNRQSFSSIAYYIPSYKRNTKRLIKTQIKFEKIFYPTFKENLLVLALKMHCQQKFLSFNNV